MNMYLYDIVSNQVREMEAKELSEIFNKKIKTLYSSAKNKTVYHDLKIAVFKDFPTISDKKQAQNKLKIHDEYWREIIGSDETFKISNYGRFKRVYKKHEQFLLPTLRKQNGELEIKVRFNGVYKQYEVKDLVAAHFLRKPKHNEVLHHTNGIKTDNYAGNLKWIDRKKLGEKTGGLSRNKEVVLVNPATMEVLEEFRSTRETARHTPYSYQSISDYCNGVRKNQYGHLFMWKEDYERKYGEVI